MLIEEYLLIADVKDILEKYTSDGYTFSVEAISPDSIEMTAIYVSCRHAGHKYSCGRNFSISELLLDDGVEYFDNRINALKEKCKRGCAKEDENV